MWQVFGQDKVITFLENSLKRGGPAHAYLFVGPPHSGKTALALDLARALNCLAPDPPCGQCPACNRIQSGKHSDVVVVRRLQDEKTGRFKREISIDQMRDVQKAAQLPPYEGKFKVFIIDGAEWLSTDAANCFLKTLEEPPAGVVFALLASKESEVLPTVASRCQALEVRPLPPGRIEGALQERWGVEASKAHLLAHLSRGCVGWALQAKDSPDLVRERQDLSARFRQLARSGLEARFAYAAELAAQFEQDQQRVLQALELWGLWWRDLLMIKGGCPQWVVNVDQAAELEKAEAALFSTSQIKGVIERTEATAQRLQHNASVRLALEVMMLGLPRAAAS